MDETCDDEFGFDVLSFDDADAPERSIEVKTTRLGMHFPDYVLATEVRDQRTARRGFGSAHSLSLSEAQA